MRIASFGPAFDGRVHGRRAFDGRAPGCAVRARVRTVLLGSVSAWALGTGAAHAQQLTEVCPDATPGTGALWGLVTDAETGIGLPGATVVATWEGDGGPVRTEGQTAIDGGYVLCHIPRGVELSLQPIVSTLGGAVVAATLTEDFLRVDLAFSFADAGADAGDDERVWACIEVTPPSRFLRCDPDWKALDQCPREEEHGEVDAELALVARNMIVRAEDVTGLIAEMRRPSDDRSLGSGPEFREAVEELVADAKRLGANALIDWERDGATLTAKAVTITVDPATCDR